MALIFEYVQDLVSVIVESLNGICDFILRPSLTLEQRVEVYPKTLIPVRVAERRLQVLL